jgi:hypothetical protein
MRPTRLVFLLLVFAFLNCEYARAQDTGWPSEHKEHELNAPTKFLVTQAIANGRKEIPVMVAANKDETEKVEQLILQAGGSVLNSIPEIGYIHAILPVDKAWWLIRQAAVTDLAIAGGEMFRDDLRPALLPAIQETDTAAGSKEKVEAEEQKKIDAVDREKGKVGGAVDLALPLLPTALLETKPGLNANAYLQRPEWLKAHPAWDGRGVTIVSAEGMPGVDHPALQEAKDICGNPIPKIGGVIDGVDYEHRNPANYIFSKYPAGNYFPSNEYAYSGEVKFGVDAKLSDGTACPKPESAGEEVGVWKVHHYYVQSEYCVAWILHDKVARIDLNRDGQFTDDQPLYDFNQTRSFVRVPYIAKPEDGRSEHYFTVYLIYDNSTGIVSILPSDGDHSAMTATAAAGTGFMGTNIGGMAPNARMMFMRPRDRLSDYVEGTWKAMARPDVDLLTDSAGIGGDNFPSEALTVAMLFHDRISEVTRKPMIAAAGNWGLPFEAGYNYSRLVIGVGGYISGEQMQAFRYSKQSLKIPLADYVIDYSSSGPNADGGLSTDILTPVPGIVGADCGSDHYAANAAEAQVGFAYRLPPCYAIGNGTSIATPRAAGAVALMLSAAKQEHLKVTPAEIKNALIVSARYLPNQPAFWQGPGLLQVEDAWKALQEAARKPSVSIISSTPDLLPLYPQHWRGPLIGKSIYITRGFHPGEKKELSLNLNVTGISTKGLSFKLLGNDGTYNIASIKCDSKGHARIVLNAVARSVGNKSALLEVRAKGRTYPMARLPILLAATPSPQSLRIGVTLGGKYGIPASDLFIFEPPEGTAALEIVGTVKGSPLRVSLVMGTNQTLTYDPDHGRQETGWIETGRNRKFIVPLQHPDLVGMMISNRETGNDSWRATEYKFAVRALTAAELEASASHDAPVLAVTTEEQFQAVPIPETPAREADIAIPDDTDAVVISFPQIAFNPAKPYATEAYLYDPRGEKQGLWNYFPVIDHSTHLAVPKPRAGTWKLVLLGTDPGPIKIEFLRHTAKGITAASQQYLAFGALCSGAECADTWPLDNPLWRFMPLFPISRQTKGAQ